MDKTKIKAQAVKFNRSRSNLIAVVVLTVVNLLALTFDYDFAFLFSAFVPQVLLIFLEEISMMAGLIAGLLGTGVYLVCYLFSKRWRWFMLVALILFLFDALIMLGFMVLSGEYGEFFLNILFHAWILFYLISGTVAWGKLIGVTPAALKEIQQEVSEDEQKEELNSAIDAIAPGDENNDEPNM